MTIEDKKDLFDHYKTSTEEAVEAMLNSTRDSLIEINVDEADRGNLRLGTAEERLKNSATVNNAVGVMDEVGQNSNEINRDSFSQEILNAAAYHGIEDPSKVSQGEMKEYEEHEATKAQAAKDALANVVGGLVGLAGLKTVLGAGHSMAKVDGDIKCEHCTVAQVAGNLSSPIIDGIIHEKGQGMGADIV